MIGSSTSSKQLGVILTNANKALSEALKNASPKELESLSKGGDLKSLLNSLLKQSTTSSHSVLLELVKNNPTLKNLGSVTDTLKDLLNSLKSDNPQTQVEKSLKNFLLDIKDIKGLDVKDKLNNSGVFLENKLKNSSEQNIKEIITNDLKAIVLKASEELSKSSHPNQNEILKHLDKLSLQIDNYQLQSYLSNSASLYLPFDWDDMEDGKLEIKHSEDDTFFCNIDLKLKEYGEVNLKLALYDTNQLNIHIYSQNDEFKKIVRENLGELKSALIDAKITPRQIKIFEPKKQQNSPYSSIGDDLKMGFEIKI